MSEVKMKSVTIGWRETHYYITTIDVPEHFDNNDIEDAFWSMDLTGAAPVEIADMQVDYIEDIQGK